MEKTNNDIDWAFFASYMQNNPKEWFKLIGHFVHHPTRGNGKIAYHIPGRRYKGGVFAVRFETLARGASSNPRGQVMLPIADFLEKGKIIFGIPDSLFQKIFEYQQEEEKGARKQSRVGQIQKFCEQRGIDFLYHFTRAENLPSIIEHGLISRKDALEQGYLCETGVNDNERYDKHEDAISISVGFPNYRVFYRFRNRIKANWVVIQLKKEILWELNCAFYRENAAAQAMAVIPLEQAKSVESFISMFNNQFGSINREKLGIPDKYPTNPQAEILVFNPIPLQYFSEIDFQDLNLFRAWQDKCAGNREIKTAVNNWYFSSRKDYSFWNSTSITEYSLE